MVVGHTVCGTADNQRDGIQVLRSGCLVHTQVLRDTVCRTVRLWPVGRCAGSAGAGGCGLYHPERNCHHPVPAHAGLTQA